MERSKQMNGPGECPVCGGPMEDGLCLTCGYDRHLDGDLSIGGKQRKEKKGDSLLDILLEDSSDSHWPF